MIKKRISFGWGMSGVRTLYIEDILVLQIPVPPGVEVFALPIDQPRNRIVRLWFTLQATAPAFGVSAMYGLGSNPHPESLHRSLGSPGMAAPARLFHSFVLPPSVFSRPAAPRLSPGTKLVVDVRVRVPIPPHGYGFCANSGR